MERHASFNIDGSLVTRRRGLVHRRRRRARLLLKVRAAVKHRGCGFHRWACWSNLYVGSRHGFDDGAEVKVWDNNQMIPGSLVQPPDLRIPKLAHIQQSWSEDTPPKQSSRQTSQSNGTIGLRSLSHSHDISYALCLSPNIGELLSQHGMLEEHQG